MVGHRSHCDRRALGVTGEKIERPGATVVGTLNLAVLDRWFWPLAELPVGASDIRFEG